MATAEDTYAITTPHQPGVIHSVSPGIVVHSFSHGSPLASSFIELAMADVNGDVTEREIIAGIPDASLTFFALSSLVFTGSTLSNLSALIFTDGAGGTEFGRVNIPQAINQTWEIWMVLNPIWVTTAGNGLFCHLETALSGTSAAYVVSGCGWKL